VRCCPLCQCDNRNVPRLPLSQEGWSLKRCPECAFVYLQEAVPYQALTTEFCWTESAAGERLRRTQAEPLLSRFFQGWKAFRLRFFQVRRMLRLCHQFLPAGPVLDIGCGKGRLLARLADECQLYGIELDPIAASLAEKNLAARDGKILRSDGLTGLKQCPPAFFSGIIMQCYLEHETQPVEVLQEAMLRLQPGGRLLIKVPNFASWNRSLRGAKWCGLRFPDHVNYFTPQTLTTMLTRVGFEIERNGFFDRLPLSDNLYLVARRPLGVSPTVTMARAA
jgi:SAM-dependent methyltransferase